jgi:hypothetical protein
MGYLDNSTVTVDAILTKKGRELLAKTGKLDVAKFALSDDEIDYTLWNPKHPLGSNYYGIVIENMPLVEAVPDESQHMRSKLITITKATGDTGNIVGIPIIDVNTSLAATSATKPITSNTTAYSITPSVSYYTENGVEQLNVQLNQTLGYTAILSDAALGTLTVTTSLPTGVDALDPDFMGDASENRTQTVVGLAFSFKAKVANAAGTKTKTGTITVIGNETGNYLIIPFTIKTVN